MSILMNDELIGIDTVGLLAYFVNKHSTKVDEIFEKIETSKTKLLIPSIVIGEMIYTLIKEKEIFGEIIEKTKLEFILDTLYENPAFLIKDLTYEGWKLFLELPISELHDRMIVATCKQEKVGKIITRDKEIVKSGLLQTIW